MTKQEYVLLYEKYVSGNCTEQEKQLLESYSDGFSLNDRPWDKGELGDEKEITDRMYDRLKADRYPGRGSGWSVWYKISAAAVLLLAIGVVLYQYGGIRPVADLQLKAVVKSSVIRLGGRKAILTLHDGSSIVLDDSKTGVVASQGKTVISKNEQGQIVYQAADADSKVDVYNTISTPRGAEAQLLLPDGTRVWLNAESSLRFPAVFSGALRRVELTGEAYLEVAENKKMPFRVVASGTEVEVLGTHFNISAYRDQQEVNTTLLEGAVKLRNEGHEALLKPGQSGVCAAGGAFVVKNVDPRDAVAWKDGYFKFQNEDIHSIMSKAARWYDVEVEYRGNMKGREFYGKVARYENITELLKNLEITGDVHFKIEGRRVVVMSK